MTTPPIYQWKKDCERRIEEIKQELLELESQSQTPTSKKQIERLEYELCNEYASLDDYKGRIINYEYEIENY